MPIIWSAWIWKQFRLSVNLYKICCNPRLFASLRGVRNWKASIPSHSVPQPDKSENLDPSGLEQSFLVRRYRVGSTSMSVLQLTNTLQMNAMPTT
jgi:hypothetical protein